jgi:hypothetical protein
MPAMVVGIDVKSGLVEKLRDVRIAQRVLAHAVRDLHNSGRAPRSARSIVGYLESVFAVERKIFKSHADAPPGFEPFIQRNTTN